MNFDHKYRLFLVDFGCAVDSDCSIKNAVDNNIILTLN